MKFRVPVVFLGIGLATAACGSDDTGSSGAGGAGASGGSGATGGAAGSGATGGSSGSGAAAGSGATGGSAGSGATGGSGGTGASAGTGGSAGAGGSGADCGTITTFESGQTPGTEIHVATTGSDTNGDGSAGNPYASIDRAVDDATPGSAVVVHAGSYAGGAFIDNLAGTASAPIWIGGAAGEASPVIDGGGEALHLSRVRYLVVHDLTIQNQANNGINADDGGDYADPEATRHVVFRNLTIRDVGGTGNQDCLKLSGLDDYYVLDSQFARCGGGMSGSGVDHVGCHHGIIARNRFEQMSGNAVQCKGGSEDIEVRQNVMIDPGERAVNMGGSTGYTFFRPPLVTSGANFEARDIRVLANVIVGGTASLAFVGCDACLAANNTIVDPQNWVLRILQETTSDSTYQFLPAQGGRFVNNIVYYDGAALSTWVNVGPNTDAPSFSFENNLWYDHANPAASAPSLPVTETGGIIGQDPGLAAPSSGDVSIGAGSPAAGAGVEVAAVRADLGGQCYASPPSVGADEVN